MKDWTSRRSFLHAVGLGTAPRPLFGGSGATLVTCQATKYGAIAHRVRAGSASVRIKRWHRRCLWPEPLGHAEHSVFVPLLLSDPWGGNWLVVVEIRL